MSNLENSKSTPCVVCAENINQGALKCSECGSFQDWRRFVFQWSGLVTSLIALAPLWAIAASLWEIAFPAKAEINMVPISCTKELITIVGTNSGGRTAVIGEPVLFVVKNKQEKSRIELISSDKDFSLKPGDVKIIEYTASSAGVAGADFPTRSQGEKCQLLISFPIIDFQEEGMNFPVYCDCPLER